MVDKISRTPISASRVSGLVSASSSQRVKSFVGKNETSRNRNVPMMERDEWQRKMENGRGGVLLRATLDSDVFEDETTFVSPIGPKEKASDGASNKRFLREVRKAFLAAGKRSGALKETEIPPRETDNL
ncbi:hypothetical protein K0M31_010327 [Melipona bicolor]|uniref:Uncharacterized protein n=1 Tax=Melipona bicolor TaxID=60889 RepID=A0AA40FML5_9HYME|nr:hypothetical protein K0M31_010327 [Melipona bicolor]